MIDKEDKQFIKHLSMFLIVILPMVAVPIISYDYFIIHYKHNSVIAGSIIVGALIGFVSLLLIDKVLCKK